jgi:hypothetical protein
MNAGDDDHCVDLPGASFRYSWSSRAVDSVECCLGISVSGIDGVGMHDMQAVLVACDITLRVQLVHRRRDSKGRSGSRSGDGADPG